MAAVEPNEAMRELGIRQTADRDKVAWSTGIGEETGQPSSHFRLVTFGSSFNVTDRPRSLKESHRLLQEDGWFACLWNHHDLDDPLQAAVEKPTAGVRWTAPPIWPSMKP